MALLVLQKGGRLGWANPNVPFVGRQFKIFCAWGKKLKHRRVGNECRLTRCPFAIRSVCCCPLVKMVYFFLVYVRRFLVVASSNTLAANSSIHTVKPYKAFRFWVVLYGWYCILYFLWFSFRAVLAQK